MGRRSSGKMERMLVKKAVFQSDVEEYDRSCVGLTMKNASNYLSNGVAKNDKRELCDVVGVVDEIYDPLCVVVHVRVASGGENGNPIITHVTLQSFCVTCNPMDVAEGKVCWRRGHENVAIIPVGSYM